MYKLQNNLYTIDGWQIIEKSFDPDMIVTTGSNFMIGNGYLGYRGTFAEWGKDQFVGCTVTDTWDKAPGSEWRELCTVPNGLFAQIKVDDELLSAFSGETSEYHRELNLKYGLYHREGLWKGEHGKKVKFSIKKFASIKNKHLLPMQITLEAIEDVELNLSCGIDGDIWSLNGDHFKGYQTIVDEDVFAIETRTNEFDIQIIVTSAVNVQSPSLIETHMIKESKSLMKIIHLNLSAGEKVTIDQVMVIYHQNDTDKPKNKAFKEARQAINEGFSRLFEDQIQAWNNIWDISDISVIGNLEDQTMVRFNLYQTIIATPTHAKLPIGARGLSCQVYQGAAFWDQETFNLPMYIFSMPEIARSLLEYRYDTLPGARNKAQKLGYEGAFYAWTSGKTGEELFPDYFFTDVLSGRKIHNHFNSWQIHISPDIVYAVWLYYEATGDWDFMLDYGIEMIFEVAKFIFSRAHFKMDKHRYELLRVLGPDEYHENVDNNSYTNYLSEYALEKAAYLYYRLKLEDPQRLDSILEKINLDSSVINNWVDIAQRIFLQEPDSDTKLIEQFDNFFDLEDITPIELQKRLIDPEEYWGWPNGIAVEAQVLKQADVLQLFILLEDRFSKEVMQANYDYYEPRTEHGSSLSPSVHATLAAWVDYPNEAYRYFHEAATIDLYNASKKVISGGSFLGGIHTAAAGAVWQMVVKGFAGFRLNNKIISFTPALPNSWREIKFKLKIHKQLVLVEISQDELALTTSNKNTSPMKIKAANTILKVMPGEKKVINY